MNATLDPRTTAHLDDAQLGAHAEQLLANPGPPLGTRAGLILSNIGGSLVLLLVLGLLSGVLRAATAIFVGPEVANPVWLGLAGLSLVFVVVMFVRGFGGRVARFDTAGIHFHFGKSVPWTAVTAIRPGTRTKTNKRVATTGNVKTTTTWKEKIRTVEIEAGSREIVVDAADAPYDVRRCRLAKALADWRAGRGDRPVVAQALAKVVGP